MPHLHGLGGFPGLVFDIVGSGLDRGPVSLGPDLKDVRASRELARRVRPAIAKDLVQVRETDAAGVGVEDVSDPGDVVAFGEGAVHGSGLRSMKFDRENGWVESPEASIYIFIYLYYIDPHCQSV